jgi:hypothetical protein
MNRKIRTLGMALLLAAAMFAAAQDAQTDRVTVPLTNPGKAATVSVEVMFGSIKVVGYEGKDVIVEAKARDRKLGDETPHISAWAFAPGAPTPTVARTIEDVGKVPPPPAAPPAPARAIAPAPPAPASSAAPNVAGSSPNYYIVKDKDKEKSQKDKAAGMKRIPIENTGLTVEENDNLVTVRVESWKRSVDITIKVPFATSLKLQGTNLEEGISVENVSGEIEVRGVSGDIALKNVSGTVVANSTNGDVEATLSKVAADKPMSFVAFNGDVDVTLPADTKATFSLKTGMGEVYSDFDMTLKTQPVKSEQSTKADKGKFHVTMDRAVSGSINGGGPEFKLQTYNGNIYIRKKK